MFDNFNNSLQNSALLNLKKKIIVVFRKYLEPNNINTMYQNIEGWADVAFGVKF